MLTDRTTLTQFLIEEQSRHPEAHGDRNALVLNVALACKAIARAVAHGALRDVLGDAATTNVQGERQKKLDVAANEIFVRANEWCGVLGGMFSEEMETPYLLPPQYPRGKYLLVFDPLDGSSNIDVNVSVGSIFSILRAPRPGADASPEDFLQSGIRQICVGYAIYGPSTMLVVTVGRGVHGFTLEPELGEFILTHPDMTIAAAASEFAINASNTRFLLPAVKRYVDECLAGMNGPRHKDFNMRWVASLVAETHRILLRGGVFLYPRDTKDPAKQGRLRLLYEANPIAMLAEQAGGAASTGHERVLEVVPDEIHRRVPFIFGSREEVEKIEHYHRETAVGAHDAPLFGTRGLFRVPA